MMAQGLDLAPSSHKDSKTRAMGSRRIFPPLFKLQVLDSYRNDRDCKGNQRATARKFNIHRRQIQKWLQCEASLRSVVAESMRQDTSSPVARLGDVGASTERRGPRVFKHDARTLKLVAQRLYPSSYPGAMLKDDFKGEARKTTPEYVVPKEYQLNDTLSVASVADAGPGRKLTMGDATRGLYLKDSVSGLKLCDPLAESKSLIQKYSASYGREFSSIPEPRSLGAAPPPAIPSNSPSPPAMGVMFGPPRLPPPHPPMFAPPFRVLRPVCPLPRPLPVHAAVSPSLPSADEPYNLVKSPGRPVESSTLRSSDSIMRSREGSPAVPAAAASPLPARVAEITGEVKTSAFSPKRKWLQDSMHDKLVSESLPIGSPPKPAPHPMEPKPKKPCPDFSIERLCGSTTPPIKSEACTPPSQSHSPSVFSPYPPSLDFPPPLLLPHRTIPDLLSLHFKPELPCGAGSPEPTVKEESFSEEDDEPIDVLSTTPVENKSFEFPGGKRRSFSVQFKLNVLDAFYNDKDCNKNQRATARKFNINRRQVQKWLSLEPELRNEGIRKKQDDLCAQCPQHCNTISVKHCMERNCLISDLKQESKPLYHWTHPSALPFLPWYNYDCNIY